ncbi:hypothetical protein OEA41_009949 [Lepraria neglecta]|uniref:Uncharacterized protein n=1 Tax=Lepraria neglecta TaxID=209136 RepID=A0AAE0DEV0_9LECA|nr:hypothetical protein OEA41_009949 [Lepraria neglecta]
MAEEVPPSVRPSSPSSTSEPESAADQERRYALLRSIRKEGGAEQFVQSISQQLLLQHDANWGDLLGAAPQALCFLGQCFVATTSSVAISSLQLPPESMLKEKTLRANLVHCSDLGRRAFSDAESKMHKVHLVTTHICEPRGPIDKVLRLIDDDELAKVDLQHQLDKLKKYSQDCVRDSAQVRDKFANWQDYARQIRLACTAADGMILP